MLLLIDGPSLHIFDSVWGVEGRGGGRGNGRGRSGREICRYADTPHSR